MHDKRGSYDVVVVGSGYGGGIAASRLARAGRSVCLLERGREIRPGEYPDTPVEAGSQVQMTHQAGRSGSRLDMFDLHVGPGMSALVGCGLGGTSLINANVCIQPDTRVFAQPPWPQELRVPGVLDTYYERARAMLHPSRYPVGTDVYRELPPKTQALQISANHLESIGGGLGTGFELAPINVNFTVDGQNHVDTLQRPCNNCGDCVTGCNVRAKNTTLMNYLPDARNHGAEIFVQCSVSHVQQSGDGWDVWFEWVGSGQDDFAAPESKVHADIVVLAAGTLGSTEILLRSKDRGTVTVSDRIGQRFSGNGDVLAFAYGCNRLIDGVGYGDREPDPNRPVGPTITGIIDRRSEDDLLRSRIIEDGAIPGALDNVLSVAFAAAAALDPDDERRHPDAVSIAASGETVGWTRAVDRTQTYLVMAHDDASGELRLDDDRIRITWPDAGEQPIFAEIEADLIACTEPLRGDYLPDPISTKRFGSNLITVHPLGGCAMADDASEGVVNHRGQVFSASEGEGVHSGLYVADGSVIPTALGVNPLLTISAIAERVVALLAADKGWTIEPGAQSKRPADWPATKPGIVYTEQMCGFWSDNPDLDFDDAESAGQEAGHGLDFILTIESDDLEEMLSAPTHAAHLVGSVECSSLSPDPLAVRDGTFRLFVDDPTGIGAKQMVYDVTATATDGATYRLHGVKRLPEGSALRAWHATTTLDVTLYETDETANTETLRGKGVLHQQLPDFLRLMRTMRVTNVAKRSDRRAWMERFGRFFVGSLWTQYGGLLGSVTTLRYEPAGDRVRRTLDCGPGQIHELRSGDDWPLRLTRFNGGAKGPVILVHGLGVSSKIFSIDTIKPNLLEFLWAAGYDCWLLDYRASAELPDDAGRPATGDDIAMYDLPPAVAMVLAETGKSKVQMVVHCYGATTFTMAMLGGYLDPRHIRSAVLSQISADVHVPWMTRIKSWAHLPALLDAGGLDVLTPDATEADRSIVRAFDRMVAPFAYPASQGGHCHDPVCHRISFLYGSLHSHQQLNDATHNVLHEMFGLAAIDQFRHLALMVNRKRIVTADDRDSYYTPDNLDRLAVPLCFIHGGDNHCYKPSSTEATFDRLRGANDPALYERHVIPGYTHLDCIYGKHAASDVFPTILTHLDMFN